MRNIHLPSAASLFCWKLGSDAQGMTDLCLASPALCIDKYKLGLAYFISLLITMLSCYM